MTEEFSSNKGVILTKWREDLAQIKCEISSIMLSLCQR